MILAVSSGTEVNKLTTSNETCDSDLPSVMDEINSTNSEEFSKILVNKFMGQIRQIYKPKQVDSFLKKPVSVAIAIILKK